jgi:hypothetical protein
LRGPKISEGQRDSLSPLPAISGQAVGDIPSPLAVGPQKESKSMDGIKVSVAQDPPDFLEASTRPRSLPIPGREMLKIQPYMGPTSVCLGVVH